MRILNWRSSSSLNGEDAAVSTSLVEGVQSCVSIGSKEGNEVHVAVSVQLSVPPEEVWTVLRAPDSPRIFRNIKAVHSCDILEDDGMGNRKLKVVHTALAKLLMMTVSFETRMMVWESQRGKSMRYAVCEPTFLKKYEGRWALTALPPAEPKSQPLPANGQAPQGLAHLGNWSQHCWNQISGSRGRTLLVLEQTMVPSMPLPGLVQRCLGDICNREINNCVADLDAELQRRKGAGVAEVNPATRAIAAWKDATSMAAASLQSLVSPLMITSS